MIGLLDGITDPEVMARAAERNRIVGKLAQQMGVSRDEARQALFRFEACSSSDGQTLH
jgi:hypothetical protein